MGDEYLKLLGLAKRANLLTLGEEECASAARIKKTRAVIVASNAAEGTRKRAESFSILAGAPCISVAETKEELGNALGKRPCAVVGICDIGMAAAIVRKLAPVNEGAMLAVEDISKRADRILKRRGKKKKRL